MKLKLITAFAVLVMLLCSSISDARYGPATPLAPLDETETAQLIFIREEEKLSRDTYTTLYGLWNKNVFANISQAEQNHMDAMLHMLEIYDVEDPVISNEVGVFNNDSLAALYVQLTEQGEESVLEAFKAAAWIEETDIADLREAIDYTDEPALQNSYGNLLAASRNHLRTFVSHINNLGVEYEAQVLDQSDVDDIVGDYTVPPSENFNINAGLNDAWFYPATNGQGFVITVFPVQKTVFLAWFTYDTELPPEDAVAHLGAPGQRWMTAQGSYSGAQAMLEIDLLSGGIFDAGDPSPTHNPGGSIVLQFENCTSGSLTYDIPSINQAGVIPIERIVSDNVILCQELGSTMP